MRDRVPWLHSLNDLMASSASDACRRSYHSRQRATLRWLIASTLLLACHACALLCGALAFVIPAVL